MEDSVEWTRIRGMSGDRGRARKGVRAGTEAKEVEAENVETAVAEPLKHRATFRSSGKRCSRAGMKVVSEDATCGEAVYRDLTPHGELETKMAKVLQKTCHHQCHRLLQLPSLTQP